MSDFESVEFDDELLSAYLDDELGPEERTRVEERLAADPQARQLLAELRGVSQAMKSLPPEKLGVDLSEAVLRRAERAILVANERTPAGGASEAAWTMPFGRSKRSWFWAGAALAAGLLLMFYERGVNERGDLPNRVAMSERDTEREAMREPMGQMEMREVGPKLAEDRFDAKEEAVDSMAVAEAPTTLAAPTQPLADASGPTSGAVALGRNGEVPALEATRELGLAFESASAAGDMVVVHVNATPAAIQGQMFDAVLLNNDIQPEKPSGSATRNVPRGDVDVVLVEATPRQIVGCMAELKKDDKNYLAIEVDEQSVANQRARSLEDREPQLTDYNRGIVPLEQKIASNRYFYSQLDAGAGQVARVHSDKVAATSPQAQAPRQSKQLETLGKYDTVAGAAVQNEAVDGSSVDQRSAGGAPGAAPVTTFGAGGMGGGQPTEGMLRSQSTASDYYYGENMQSNARRAVQKLATKADMLQVLFVLTCPSETPPLPGASTVDSASSQPAATASEPASPPQPATSPATDDSVR